jgi:hypothetical protein
MAVEIGRFGYGETDPAEMLAGMTSFELKTHHPERTRLFQARPASQIHVFDADGDLVLEAPTIRRSTRRDEYPLTGALVGDARLVRTSWSRFRLNDRIEGELARFVMRSPRPGRRMRPSWEIRPAGGDRIVLLSDVPFSTVENLKRDLRNEILATYRCDDGFQLDVYPGRGELTIDPTCFPAPLKVAVIAGLIARALHSSPTP